MPTRIVRVFVASPADVSFERSALGKLVHEINQTIAAVAPEKGVRLELVGWETHAYPAIGRPQGVINDQIGEYDIFVGIMWRRFGTPTTEAGSGTEEEFDRAYEEFQQRGAPQIMFYFCQEHAAPPKSTQEAEQLSRVVAFRDRLSGLALVWEYGQHVDFADTVRPHLLRGMMRVLEPRDHLSKLTLVDDSPRLSSLRERLVALASKYAQTRKEMPRGDARTRQLELIATEIKTVAFDGRSLLQDFANGARPEERLVAAVFLQVTPEAEYLSWLGERLAELQPFVGYHAAVGLLAAARNLDCSESGKIDAAIAIGFKRLGSKPKTDRYRTLMAARIVLHKRCTLPSLLRPRTG